MPSMGLDAGLNTRACKRKHRWLMSIDGVSGTSTSGAITVLPPQRGARPQLIFKEMVAKHLNEDVYYPAKPDWKPVNLTLYDIKTDNSGDSVEGHPVFNWIRDIYIPADAGGADVGSWVPPIPAFLGRDTRLQLFDGCGNILETWVYKQAWPQSINFQDLDMGNSQILTCDLTLRYVRAFVES